MNADALRGTDAVGDDGLALRSKGWRERIADAEARERAARWRPWRRAADCFPFTPEDRRAWASIDACPAAEVMSAYGLNHVTGYGLFRLGDAFLRGVISSSTDLSVKERLASAHRIIGEIEDRALELKREAHA